MDGVDINGNDTDNIDNWRREGDPADHWAFVGVVDAEDFSSAELRELRGKDFQQVLLFTDGFAIQVLPEPAAAWLNAAGLFGLAGITRLRRG